jgi:hypothetical protein
MRFRKPEKRKLFVVLEDGQSIEGFLDPSFDAPLRNIALNYRKKDIAVTLIGLARFDVLPSLKGGDSYGLKPRLV